MGKNKKIELALGQRFGEWTVISRSRKSHWVCRCSCGKEQEVYVSTLTRSRSTRCGQCRSVRPFLKDRTGERIGFLVVLSYHGECLGRRGSLAHHWLCKCDCGEKVIVRVDNLDAKHRASRTCGCSRAGERSCAWKGLGQLGGEKWGQILKGAKSRNISVEITMKYAWDLFQRQEGICALTGWPLTLYSKSRSASRDTDASLDRIDSSLGYIEGNVQWVHKWANQAKNDLTMEEFVSMCRAITGVADGL